MPINEITPNNEHDYFHPPSVNSGDGEVGLHAQLDLTGQETIDRYKAEIGPDYGLQLGKALLNEKKMVQPYDLHRITPETQGHRQWLFQRPSRATETSQSAAEAGQSTASPESISETTKKLLGTDHDYKVLEASANAEKAKDGEIQVQLLRQTIYRIGVLLAESRKESDQFLPRLAGFTALRQFETLAKEIGVPVEDFKKDQDEKLNLQQKYRLNKVFRAVLEIARFEWKVNQVFDDVRNPKSQEDAQVAFKSFRAAIDELAIQSYEIIDTTRNAVDSQLYATSPTRSELPIADMLLFMSSWERAVEYAINNSSSNKSHQESVAE